MSIDTVNSEVNTKKDITWKDLIEASESQIKVCESKIKELRKSLIFFKKQVKSGIPMPAIQNKKTSKIS